MSDEQLLLFSKKPSPGQRRAIVLAGLLFLVAFIASIPFRLTPLRQIAAFIPIVDTVLLLGDGLTATLLFAQARVLNSRALVALATGYLFTAFIIIPHALTFPNAFAPNGLLGAGVSTTIWIYTFWHTGLPIAVMVYARMKEIDSEHSLTPASTRSIILLGSTGALTIAAVLTALATASPDLLPVLMTDSIHWLSDRYIYVVIALLVLNVTAMVMVLRRQLSILDLWLLLAMWAWFLELVLVMLTSLRFSGGWYTGRIAGLVSGVIVLVMLLAETNKLYARLALAVMSERREREGRMLTINMVAASIAHEAKQPLSSIVADASAGQILLEQSSTDRNELTDILVSIKEEAFRASRTVDSIQAMVAKRPTRKAATDLNALVRTTIKLISLELNSSRVELELDLEKGLPELSLDRLQLQQVLLNLLTNAVDALSGVEDRARLVVVKTMRIDSCKASITVEDSGCGFDLANQNRLFEAFYTTKSHGTGMGLALCQQIVRAHGGLLVASPRTPFGATFQILLPLDHTDLTLPEISEFRPVPAPARPTDH